MNDNAETKRVFVTEHEGHTLYWEQPGLVLEHLEELLPECEPGAEIKIFVEQVTQKWLDGLLEFEGY